MTQYNDIFGRSNAGGGGTLDYSCMTANGVSVSNAKYHMKKMRKVLRGDARFGLDSEFSKDQQDLFVKWNFYVINENVIKSNPNYKDFYKNNQHLFKVQNKSETK